MSRRRLRGGSSQTMTSPPFSRVELSSSAGDSLALRSREIPRGELGVFSDDSDVEESLVGRSSKSFQHSVSSNQSIKTTLSFASRKTRSGTISYGLDGETDAEEESPGPRFAKPIVRRGAASLLKSMASLSSTDSSKSHNNKAWEGGQMGNHVSTTTTTTFSKTSHALNGRRYQFNQETKELENVRSWSDMLYSWSHYYWQKCKETSIILSTTIILWLANVQRAVRSRISRKQHRSHSLDIRHSENDVKKTSRTITTTVTTTTVMSRKQTLYNATGKFLGWYKEKRRQNPCLWAWIPLLLLLLLVPLLFYLTQGSEPVTSSSTSVPVTSSKLYSLIAKSTSWVYLQCVTLLEAITKTAIYLSVMCIELSLYCLETIWWAVLVIFQTVYSLFMSGLGYVFSVFSSIGGFFTYSSDKISSIDSSQYLTSSYTPLVMVSDAYSYVVGNVKTVAYSSYFFVVDNLKTVGFSSYSLIVDNLKTFGNSVWLVGTQGASYTLSGFVGLWDLVLWVVYFAWFVISSLFSSLCHLGCHLSDFTITGISETIRYSSKIFMLFPLIGTTSDERTEPEIVVHTPPSQTSSDVIIQQILQSPQLQNFVLLSFQKNMAQNDLSKDSLLAAARLHIEAEVEKLRSEISESDSSKFSTAREEILLIQSQQHELLSQIKDIEATLKTIFSSQKTIQEDLKSRDNLELVMSGFSENIKKLAEQFGEFKKDHDSLALEVRSCCRNASLTMEQVERHVSTILADLIGLHPKEEGDEDVLSSRFGAWLKSYFIAKDELEGRINVVLESVQTGHIQNDGAQQEAIKQTIDLAMDSVLEQVRAEMKANKKNIDSQIQKVEDDAISSMEKYSTMEKQNVENYINIEKLKLQDIVLKSQTDMKDSIQDVVEDTFNRNIPAVIEEKLQAELKQSVKAELPAIMETYSKEYENKLADEISHLDQKVSQHVEERINVQVQLMKSQGGDGVQLKLDDGLLVSGLNESEVQRIVKTALLKYDADKTGMVDHALESGGGSVVSTRCTEGFQGHQAELTVFGYSVYRYSTNTPRSVIQPERNPGQCYAFKGTQGYIVIQFAGPVRVTAFTVEHIPKALTPSGTIDSAPKEFSVHGLQNTEEEGFHLGNFIYKDNGEPLQFFPVKNQSEDYFKYVELKIHSNHGNMVYTCIYRFRVHGVRKF